MFTSDSLEFLRFFLGKVWDIFGITIPGTHISFSNFMISCLITCFVIKLVRNIFNVVPSSGDSITTIVRRNKEK